MTQVLGYLVLAVVAAAITYWLRREAKNDLTLPLSERIERTRAAIEREPRPQPLKFERAEKRKARA